MSPSISNNRSGAGAAILELATGERLTYSCEPELHCISVRDSHGCIRFAFGGQGSGPGQFDAPLDVVLVAPEFDGEGVPDDAPEAAWLAVADYGNRRVQIFDLDGCFVGTVGDTDGVEAGLPCRLTWRAPTLVVDGVDGARTVMHLTAALFYASTRCEDDRPAFRTMVTSGETH